MACNNMFAVLSDNESDEEFQSNQPQQKSQGADGRSRKEKRSNNVQKKPVEQPKSTQGNDKKANTNPKQKGVSSDPHPLDRQSGNGVGKRDKKEGSGKGNWGNYKDEMRQENTDQQDGESEPVKPVEDNSLTYAEYLAQKANRSQNQDDNVEKKADYSALLKEGCTLIDKRNPNEDKTTTKKSKHEKKQNNYNVTINSENSDLLGFRTGLQTYTLKDRENREERPREERKPREEKQEVTEETTEPKEGEETTTEQKPREQRENNNRGFKGGRGGRGGRGRGGKSYGGYKNEGRDNYKSTKKTETSANVNFEDDSSFPKLA